MSTKKYTALLEMVIERALPLLDKDIPFLIAIDTQSMELSTVRQGLIKAKSEYVSKNKLAKNIQLVFYNPKQYTTDKKFTGFALGFRTYVRKDLATKDL